MSEVFERRPGGGSLVQHAFDNPGEGTPGKRTLVEQLAGGPSMQRSSVPGKGSRAAGAAGGGPALESQGAEGHHGENPAAPRSGAAGRHVGGFARYGGGSVRDHLTRLTNAGVLKLTGAQIAMFDAVSQVETGGQIGCVQTYDDQVVSVGFKQVVLGHGSLEKLMVRAPAGFAKHGLVLDTSGTYQKQGWSNHPHRIAGCDDVEQLRAPEWAIRFYYASMEPDVIAAMCELLLKEQGTVNDAIDSRGGDHTNYLQDLTAQAWLLEVRNNRPAFMPKVIERVREKPAQSRDEFLDALSSAIVETYVAEEPRLHYRKAKEGKQLSPEQDAELLARMKLIYEPIGRHKGTNIVTKISRALAPANVNTDGGQSQPAPAARGATAAGAAAPAAVSVAGPASSAPTAAGADEPIEAPALREADEVTRQPARHEELARADEAAPRALETASSETPVRVRVIARGLNVRKSATTDAEIVGGLRRGDTVEVIGREGKWLGVIHDGAPAFIHGDYVQVAEMTPTTARPAAPAATSSRPQVTDAARQATRPPRSIPAPPRADELPWWLDEEAHEQPGAQAKGGGDPAGAGPQPPGTAAPGAGAGGAAGVAPQPSGAAAPDLDAPRRALLIAFHSVRAPLAERMSQAQDEQARRRLRDELHQLDEGYLQLLESYPAESRYQLDSNVPDREEVLRSAEAALQLRAAYLAERRLGHSEAGRRDADHHLSGMTASRHAGDGGAQWCGAFANAQHGRAGMDSELGRAFMATGNVERFFRYIHDGRNPAWIRIDGAWQRVEEVHQRRGSMRQWWNADAVRSLQVTPQPGDIVLIDHSGGARAEHVAMVHSYDPSSHRLTLIDGNGGGFVVDHRPHADRRAADDPDQAQAEAAAGGQSLSRGGHGDVTMSVRDLDDTPTASQVAADIARVERHPGARRRHSRIYGIGRMSIVDYEEHEYSASHPSGSRAAHGASSHAGRGHR